MCAIPWRSVLARSVMQDLISLGACASALAGNCDGGRSQIIQGWNILMGLWRWRVRLLRRRDVALPESAATATGVDERAVVGVPAGAC